MKELIDLFNIQYGHSLEFNRLTVTTPDKGIPFVSRQRKNNGVVAYVNRVSNLEPNGAGELTCALNGQGGVMSAFLQDEPYYTAFHVACLRPKVEMTRDQKLYYCSCLWENHFRYSWGRQANRSVKTLLIPSLDEIPEWVRTVEGKVSTNFCETLESLANMPFEHELPDTKAAQTHIHDIFRLKYGHSLELNRLKHSANGVNFVSRTAQNNGVSAKVEVIHGLEPAPAGLITVACGGSVMESFYQPAPFYCGRDIYWLEAIDILTLEEMLFYCHCIKSNRFRYHYGRQANKTLGGLPVPSRSDIPSWVYGSIKRLATNWQRRLVAR